MLTDSLPNFDSIHFSGLSGSLRYNVSFVIFGSFWRYNSFRVIGSLM
jgi:hypothetical protein